MNSTPITANEADGRGRMKGVTVVKPIVYGNESRFIGTSREDGHTHEWTVYVKPYYNEDLSYFIKKVQFQLHDSFPNPTRVCSKPPFEVKETGWGEFEIVIKIYFLDNKHYKPVTLRHELKLHPTNPEHFENSLVSESYDEIIFSEPVAVTHYLLTHPPPSTVPWIPHETDFEEKKKKSLERILKVKADVRGQLSHLKTKLNLANLAISKCRFQMKESKAKRTSVPRVPIDNGDVSPEVDEL